MVVNHMGLDSDLASATHRLCCGMLLDLSCLGFPIFKMGIIINLPHAIVVRTWRDHAQKVLSTLTHVSQVFKE